jgi:sensor domain CHASE-containing protein/two-component sensor histidine kinase
VRIASKINTALFAIFACGLLAVFAVLHLSIQPKFEEIERSDARMNHKRVTDAFEAMTEKLETATQDYAFWDETYGFVQGENAEEFVASNLSPEFKAVANLGVNTLVFLDAEGGVRWGAAYDLETEATLDGIVKEIASFAKSQSLTGTEASLTARGLMQTSKGLFLVAIAPALKSDHSGPAMGKVATAKMLDIEAAKQLTGVDFSLALLSDAMSDAELPDTVQLTTLQDRIETTSLIRSVVGKPLAYLKVNSSRSVSLTGSIAIRSAMFLMMLVALTTAAGVWLFLKLAIVSRIEALKTHFATAGSSGTIKQAALRDSKDEIGDLARSFNSMAGQVNHLRDALADSAYMSGLSEWAAGTLHNVRNGLAPVAATTWQVEQLFNEPWVKNIEVASIEYADAATPPERRLKLNAYLIGVAARFAEVAKQTTDLTGQVKGATKSVLDMVSEFERYAHRKTDLEAVNILPLIDSVAASTIAIRAKDIELVLPAASATVSANGIILRQIVSNILVNATEAIESQPRRGRIEVSIAAHPGKAGFTRIAISDNGEGLAQDNLNAVFQRGYSTRLNRSGGLGLHWCGNAIKLLGGTIHAESDGLGLGTKIVVDLPNFEQNVKEAA